MRRLLSALLVLCAAICFFAFATKKPVQVFDIRAYKAKQLVRCTPDLKCYQCLARGSFYSLNAWFRLLPMEDCYQQR